MVSMFLYIVLCIFACTGNKSNEKLNWIPPALLGEESTFSAGKLWICPKLGSEPELPVAAPSPRRHHAAAADAPELKLITTLKLTPTQSIRWNFRNTAEAFLSKLNLSSSTGVLHFCARNSFSSTVCCSWSLGLLRKFSFTQWLYRNLKCLIHRWDIWVGCYLTFQIQKTHPIWKEFQNFRFVAGSLNKWSPLLDLHWILSTLYHFSLHLCWLCHFIATTSSSTSFKILSRLQTSFFREAVK